MVIGVHVTFLCAIANFSSAFKRLIDQRKVFLHSALTEQKNEQNKNYKFAVILPNKSLINRNLAFKTRMSR